MGNAASLNENLNSKIQKLDSMDLNFTKPYFKSSSNNKCSACDTGISLLTLKRRKCTQCLEHYCIECVTHYKESIYICYRCQIFISPKLSWTELMTLRSKDLVWFLDRKKISHPHCTDKEQLADIILDKFTVARDQEENDLHRQRLTINMRIFQENLLNSEQGPCSSSETMDSNAHRPSDHSHITSSSSETTYAGDPNEAQACPDSTSTVTKPPSYDAAIEGLYASVPLNHGCQRVKIEEVPTLSDIEDLSVKQLKDLLAHNKVDYKGCIERHELVTRAQRLWVSYNDDRGHFAERESSEARECIICMDQPVDCVLIECGHMLCCVRCGSRLAECPLCRQNVVRCIRVFSAH